MNDIVDFSSQRKLDNLVYWFIHAHSSLPSSPPPSLLLSFPSLILPSLSFSLFSSLVFEAESCFVALTGLELTV